MRSKNPFARPATLATGAWLASAALFVFALLGADWLMDVARDWSLLWLSLAPLPSLLLISATAPSGASDPGMLEDTLDGFVLDVPPLAPPAPSSVVFRTWTSISAAGMGVFVGMTVVQEVTSVTHPLGSPWTALVLAMALSPLMWLLCGVLLIPWFGVLALLKTAANRVAPTRVTLRGHVLEVGGDRLTLGPSTTVQRDGARLDIASPGARLSIPGDPRTLELLEKQVSRVAEGVDGSTDDVPQALKTLRVPQTPESR